MKPTRLLPLACLFVLCTAHAAPAQTFVPVQADTIGSPMSLLPLAGTNTTANPMFADAAGTTGLNLTAQVAGKSSANTGNAQIGFDFLRPYWTSRDFTLAVPAANAGSFPLLGNIGNVDDHFGFVPNIKYKYDVSDLAFSVNASGTFLNLSGNLQQKLSNAAGDGVLTANSSLTIIVANLPEVSTRVYYDELFPNHPRLHHWSLFEDLVIDVGIGTRYSSIDQSYTGQLTNTVGGAPGNNMTQRYSTQNFKGIGLTTKMDFSLPVRQDWVLFTNVRGSILVGDNSQDSSLTVNVAGTPGIPNSISQDRTQFVPVVEIESGIEWGIECGDRLRFGTTPPFCTVRVAAVGQFWGGVGPLSAGSPQGFRTSNLFLVGANVTVGIHR
jgi:hypothetical protein